MMSTRISVLTIGIGSLWICGSVCGQTDLDAKADSPELRAIRVDHEPSARPIVKHGTLVIVGGGAVPPDVARTFVEIAGGPDALIVVLPTAQPDRAARKARVPEFLSAAGATNIRILAQREADEFESEEFRDTLREARGIWFSGGRQWRFVDAYANTSAMELFRDVLRRGGVIGGTSAGASIQAELLVRGDPRGNTVMLAEGYQRGFGYLPGTAIDQHFTQRKRHDDLEQLIRSHPQWLGIGVDESTALVVRGRIARIIGKHRVMFFDATRRVVRRAIPAQNNADTDSIDESMVRIEPFSVSAGSAFDLVRRRPVSADSKESLQSEHSRTQEQPAGSDSQFHGMTCVARPR